MLTIYLSPKQLSLFTIHFLFKSGISGYLTANEYNQFVIK